VLSLLSTDLVFRYVALACVVFASGSWLVSLITGNYSQVDRLWSILPPIYAIGFAAATRFSDLRLDAIAVLVALWGARLTYNFARKGGYTAGHEDYRWPVLRARFGPWKFQIFNATFIAPFQNLLLMLITLPAWAALRAGTRFGVLDVAATILFLLLLVGETVADQQQWRFHEDKHARLARGEAIAEPFLTRGLFRYSRHPNFFCEIAMWWCIYAFSVAAGAGVFNMTLVGPILLTLLFQGSTTMTERLSLEKYPSYAAYQRTTSRLVPLPPTS